MVLVFSGCAVNVPLPKSTKNHTSQEAGGVLSGGSVKQAVWKTTVRKVLPKIFKINVTGCNFTGSGSGFKLGKWVVTNRHVVDDARAIQFTDSDGKIHKVKAWYTSSSDDLAVLDMGDFEGDGLTLASVAAQSGDLVATGGYPLGGPQVSNQGRVIKFIDPMETNESGSQIIETSAQILPGDSGGPLLNTKGEVVGVMFALNLEDGSFLAISSDRLVNFMDQAHVSPNRAARCR